MRCMSIAGHRRQQVWEATAQRRAPALLQGAPVNEEALLLPAAPEGEEIVVRLRLAGPDLAPPSAGPAAPAAGAHEAAQRGRAATSCPMAARVAACGIVTVRQQPQTAKGTIFVTLEDETGPVNVIVWKHVREAQREALLRSRLLAVYGQWQCDVDSGGQVRHLIASSFRDLTPLMGRLAQRHVSRDFH